MKYLILAFLFLPFSILAHPGHPHEIIIEQPVEQTFVTEVNEFTTIQNDVNTEQNGGIAASAAMGSIPEFDGKGLYLGIGAATFYDETAAAIGIGYKCDDAIFTIKAGKSVDGKPVVGAGASFGL